MSNKTKVRPTTGHLLIGGNLDHDDSGIFLTSWLSEPNPEDYLLSEEHFNSGQPYDDFFAGALKSGLTDYIIDIPRCPKTGVIQYDDTKISILFLPEGEPWCDALEIALINWDQLTFPGGNKCRNWSSCWFEAFITDKLVKKISILIEIDRTAEQKRALSIIMNAVSGVI